MRRAAIAAALLVCAYVAPAWARNPPIAIDPRGGVWIAHGDQFIFATVDRWSVYPAGANVNKMTVDDMVLWVATDDGVIRFDTGSRRATRLTMDDGLPSQVVTAVAFDDQYVWFATNKGLARYRKLDRTIRTYSEKDGLPHKAVNDALTVGRQVWFGTREGLAVYSPDVDGLRSFGEKDGLASGDIAELYQVADDVWCRTDVGLSRFRVQQRVFNNFSLADMHADQILSFTVTGQDIWIGTDKGLWQFMGSSDALLFFPQQMSFKSERIVGIEADPSYVYITTDKEVMQFSVQTNAIRRWTEAENLTQQEGSTGTVMLGGVMVVMLPDGAQLLDVQRDQWRARTYNLTEESESATKARIFGTLDAQTPYNLKLPGGGRGFETERYANAQGGIGFGHRFSGDRVLDGSIRLDYGQLEASGIRDLQYKVEYRGNQNDVLRDVHVEDKWKYRTVEEGIERPLLLQGAEARVASPGAEPKAALTTTAGFRRGVVMRDFLVGPRQDVYTLSKPYIVPGSERVYVDGELLSSGTDYTIVYTAGQLSFLNAERIDDLSVITVEYEYDLVPKKDLGTLSLVAMLPSDNEVGGWTRAGDPQLVSNEAALYNQIDGGAPKYIERGWSRAVYATFKQGSRSIQVAIHDMGTDAQAEAIYNYELPASRQPLDDRTDAVIDLSSQTAYSTKAYFDHFYLELNIDERSDAALTSIKLFTAQILDRKQKAGANNGDQFKEWMTAARGAYSPTKGVEIGARAVELHDLKDPRDPATGAALVDPVTGQPVKRRRQINGGLDARYQREVGEGGLFTGYGELMGSEGLNSGDPQGWAGMGFLRFSHSRLEGTVSGRHDASGFTALGSDATRMGKLQDELRVNATGYPVMALPTTVFFTRQRAWLPDGTEGTGTIQHALARVQLNQKGLPATSLQLGSTLLEDSNYKMSKIQAVGQTDYDLAPALWFTRIKRFNVRALYSVSQAETDKQGTDPGSMAFNFADRIQLTRFEAKLSPTNTEQIWSLFRSRMLDRQTAEQGPYQRGLFHWELTSGAQSTIIPGLVPKVSYNEVFEDNRITSPDATSSSSSSSAGTRPDLSATVGAVTAPGPGKLTLYPATKTSQGGVSAELGIYPGQWWSRLAPVALVPRVNVSNQEITSDNIKNTFNRIWIVDNRAVWAGGGKLELELTQRRKLSTTGEDRHDNGTLTEFRNRIVYRPVFSSPLTLRLNYVGTRDPNDPALAGTDQVSWATKANYDSSFDWLMRWNRVLTTLLRPRLIRTDVSNLMTRDPSSTTSSTPVVRTRDYTQYQSGVEIELRMFPLMDASALYVAPYARIFRCWGDGDGASDAVTTSSGVAVIWRVGDKIYLDGMVEYQGTSCLGGTCTAVSRLVPRVYFTMNL